MLHLCANHASAMAQGTTCEEVQQLLVSPKLAAAVHQVLRQYAPLIPALAKIGLQDAAGRLRFAATRLRFLHSCHTRLVRLPSTDVTRPDVPSQVCPIRIVCLVLHCSELVGRLSLMPEPYRL